MVWAAADVHRITHGRDPPLHEIARQTTENAANQNHQRDAVVMESDRFGKFFDWEWAVRVNLLVAGVVGFAGSSNQIGGSIKLRHHPVDWRVPHSGFTSASGSSVRISKIEMLGSNRKKRNMHAVKKPKVPMNVAQSHRVG